MSGGLDLTSEPVCWALDLRPLRAVVVVEVAYRVDGPIGVHLCVRAPRGAAEALKAAGWRPRGWLPRSWGALARADLAERERHDES